MDVLHSNFKTYAFNKNKFESLFSKRQPFHTPHTKHVRYTTHAHKASYSHYHAFIYAKNFTCTHCGSLRLKRLF